MVPSFSEEYKIQRVFTDGGGEDDDIVVTLVTNTYDVPNSILSTSY